MAKDKSKSKSTKKKKAPGAKPSTKLVTGTKNPHKKK